MNEIFPKTLEQKLYYILRIAIVMCFIGHGAFGIITKEVWCNYFAVFGIGKETAYRFMPIIGTMDITMGLIMLVYPVRAVALWLVIWGFFTALLRPMSNEPFAEFVERAGNYGAPLALLFITGIDFKNIKSWFARINPNIPEMVSKTKLQLTNCLKITVFLLLAGHGYLNLIEKKGLIGQYVSIGFSNPEIIAKIVGIFEICAAFMVLFKPIAPILFTLLIWKMGSEVFYPHWGSFEWIERGGSYCAILALMLILPKTVSSYVFKRTYEAGAS